MINIENTYAGEVQRNGQLLFNKSQRQGIGIASDFQNSREIWWICRLFCQKRYIPGECVYSTGRYGFTAF